MIKRFYALTLAIQLVSEEYPQTINITSGDEWTEIFYTHFRPPTRTVPAPPTDPMSFDDAHWNDCLAAHLKGREIVYAHDRAHAEDYARLLGWATASVIRSREPEACVGIGFNESKCALGPADCTYRTRFTLLQLAGEAITAVHPEITFVYDERETIVVRGDSAHKDKEKEEEEETSCRLGCLNRHTDAIVLALEMRMRLLEETDKRCTLLFKTTYRTDGWCSDCDYRVADAALVRAIKTFTVQNPAYRIIPVDGSWHMVKSDGNFYMDIVKVRKEADEDAQCRFQADADECTKQLERHRRHMENDKGRFRVMCADPCAGKYRKGFDQAADAFNEHNSDFEVVSIDNVWCLVDRRPSHLKEPTSPPKPMSSSPASSPMPHPAAHDCLDPERHVACLAREIEARKALERRALERHPLQGPVDWRGRHATLKQAYDKQQREMDDLRRENERMNDMLATVLASVSQKKKEGEEDFRTHLETTNGNSEDCCLEDVD